MLSSFLPFSYFSPLRSLTGTSRSRDNRQSGEGNARDLPSGDLDNHQPGYSAPKPFSLSSARHSPFLINSGLPAKGLLLGIPPDPLPAPPIPSDISSLSLASSSSRTSVSSVPATPTLCSKSLAYSCRFPLNHCLNTRFHQKFRLEEELGAGGYGFVMVASRRVDDKGVAVKFIIKDKVPEHAWTKDSRFGRIPTEVLLLALVDHPYIAKCLDLYEDDVYYYLVQELHGSPWLSPTYKRLYAPGYLRTSEIMPSLSSCESVVDSDSDFSQSTLSTLESVREKGLLRYGNEISQQDITSLGQEAFVDHDSYLQPGFPRRPSHDLFECIEQSPLKRLSEKQARYVFAQIVDAVLYLDSQGISHCDIKDENILVDADFNVRLIDFGSAVVTDCTKPAPFYNLFFGTAAYASSEVLQRKPYQTAPAEVWALGVLLSYLLTGSSPFPTEEDAIVGRIVINSEVEAKLSPDALGIMRICLIPDPEKRATIKVVSKHRWLDGALDA